MFTKYQHLEKLGHNEVEGIMDGECYIFPKIDGTNGSVWFSDEGLQAGSRNRHLTLDNDNAGFLAAMREDESLANFLAANPTLTLYGEWLVPHTLKTYTEDAWRQFYIFDVWDRQAEKFLSYGTYSMMLDEYNLKHIFPICIVKNPIKETLFEALKKNTYLIEDGKGIGEGIVLKNYDFVNQYGRTVWLKLVNNDFKTRHTKEMGVQKIETRSIVEDKIVDEFVDVHMVEKEYAKIMVDGGMDKSTIPRLLETVFYTLVKEHAWDMVKNYKHPEICTKRLKRFCILKVKELKPELF